MLTTLITPVAVFPGEANTLAIRSITLGPPPSYYYQLQHVEVVTPVIEQVDLVTGKVTKAGSPEQTVVTVLKDGNVNMTEQQWQNWAANLGQQGDDEYQLSCIATNLGLVRV